AAGKLLPEDWKCTQVETLLTGDTPAVRLTAEEAEKLAADLAPAQAALTEARRLGGFPEGRYPVAWQKHLAAMQQRPVQTAGRAVRLLAADALRRAEAEDADGAMESCRAALNVGRSLGDEQTAIAQLVRVGCVSRTLRTAERTLAQGAPAEAGLASFQRLLE